MAASYPCVVCMEPCSCKCIQCFGCERWTHASCVPMSDSVLKSWDKHLMNFYCPNCCFIGGRFDAEQSLKRLKTSLDSGKRKGLITTATNEKLLLSTYNVSLPPCEPEHKLALPTDIVSKSILQMFHPVLLQEFYPSSTIGDGNCMYRAISTSITGSEDFHPLLRLCSPIFA